MENSEEPYYWERALLECETIQDSLQGCLDSVIKLNQKYNLNWAGANDEAYQKLTSRIFPASTEASKEKQDSPLEINNTESDVSLIDDDFEANSGASTPLSRHSSQTAIPLQRTPSEITQSQNDVKVKLIKLKRSIESVLTSLELIFAKYEIKVYKMVHLKK